MTRPGLAAAALQLTAALVLLPLAAGAQGVPRDEKYRKAEDACDFFFAALYAKTMDIHANQMQGWRYTCEHHPDRLRCEDTNDVLERRVGKRFLDCSAAGK